MADMIETMKSQKILKSCYANTKFLIIFFILVIVSTRAVTIGHNMLLHPDESVFFSASESLKQYLVGSAKEYEEEKEYPEGAIVLQLPFHIGGAVLRKIIGIDFSARLIGRISSVFYFSAGMVFGFIILDKFFSASIMTLVQYGAIMAFSLLHIEQSRYGTGDVPSFFLLMALILCTAMSIRKDSRLYLLIAFFSCGVLSAVKYPLVDFYRYR